MFYVQFFDKKELIKEWDFKTKKEAEKFMKDSCEKSTIKWCNTSKKADEFDIPEYNLTVKIIEK